MNANRCPGELRDHAGRPARLESRHPLLRIDRFREEPSELSTIILSQKRPVEDSHEWIDLPDRPDRCHSGYPFVLWAAVGTLHMTFEVGSPLDEDMVPFEDQDWFLQWTPVVAGAVGAAAR